MPNYFSDNSKHNFRQKPQISTKLRCSFYTRDGRCIRNAARHSIYCWIHHQRVMQSSVPQQTDVEKSSSDDADKVILLTDPIEPEDTLQPEIISAQDQTNNEIDMPQPLLTEDNTTTPLPESTINTEPVIEEAKIPIEEKPSACVIC